MTSDHNKILYDKIRETAMNEGSFLVGFADLTPLRGIQAGDDTIFQFPSAITFAVEIPEAAAKASMSKPSIEMREAYKMCNKKLKAAGEKIVAMLTEAGYKARFIDPAQRVNPELLLGAISQKAIAAQAGLGWIGKNGLFITEKYGPRQRMGAVLTDMPMKERAVLIDNKCGDCTACIDKCAMKVLKGTSFKHHPASRDDVIDWAKCGDYEKRLIGDGSKPEMACGRCIAVCPFSFQSK
jgi:epoxyqueuosine reductase